MPITDPTDPNFDPNNPNGNNGLPNPNPSLTSFTAPSTPVPAGLGAGGLNQFEDSAGQIAANMQAKDSPLQQRARAEALQFSNQRGLANSSIAAGATEGALLDRITPLASQTASQNFQKNTNLQQVNESDKDRAIKLDLANREEAIQRDELANSAFQAEADRRLKQTLDTAGISADDRRGAEDLYTNAFVDFENAQRSILSNTDVSAEERNRLLLNTKNMLSVKVTYINDLYSTNFDWPDNPYPLVVDPNAPDDQSDPNTTVGSTTPDRTTTSSSGSTSTSGAGSEA